jgi:hypothetical protein
MDTFLWDGRSCSRGLQFSTAGSSTDVGDRVVASSAFERFRGLGSDSQISTYEDEDVKTERMDVLNGNIPPKMPIDHSKFAEGISTAWWVGT